MSIWVFSGELGSFAGKYAEWQEKMGFWRRIVGYLPQEEMAELPNRRPFHQPLSFTYKQKQSIGTAF